MSSDGGLGGALLISNQLSWYRWEDYFRRMRETNALTANDAAWRNQYNDLVNRYNRLLADAKRLADIQDTHIAGLEAQIAELKKANVTLEAETRQLHEERAKVRFQLAVERQWHQEKRPDEFS